MRLHVVDCSQLNKCKIKLPIKNNILSFENFYRKERVSVIIYADYECILKPPQDDQHDRVISNHQALSIGYYIKYSFVDPEYQSQYKFYRQIEEGMQTPSEWFVDQLKEIAMKMDEKFANVMPMNLTPQQLKEYESAETCHICEGRFYKEDCKVKDHCHLSGRLVF